jgi:predicted nucleotidyltransferase
MPHDLAKVIAIVKQYADDVINIYHINKVILYGSYAQGTAKKK